jgi:hypothetical protein
MKAFEGIGGFVISGNLTPDGVKSVELHAHVLTGCDKAPPAGPISAEHMIAIEREREAFVKLYVEAVGQKRWPKAMA